MAVTDQTPIGGAVGNGVTTVFPFAYYIGDEADLVVQRDGVNATLNVDYVVSGAGNPSGGQIAFVTAPANGVKVTHFRNTSLTRAADYQDGGDLQARTVNLDFDRLWLALQEIFSGGKGAPTALRVPQGETVPALPKASDRALKMLVFDSSGNPVVAVTPTGTAADVLAQLLDSNNATKGSGLSGHGGQLGYAAGTAGAALNSVIRVADQPYLAACDGVVDDTAAIQAAVTWAAQQFDADWFSVTTYTRPRVVKLGRTHKVTSKILVPRGVVIDMSDTTIIGNGSNQVFETAYFNAGVLTTNIGTAPETHRIQYTRFIGGRFVNCGKVFNLYNFNEGCEVKGAAFMNCVQALVAERAFYAEFSNLTSRGSAGSSTAWCFDFGFFVNVERIIGITVVDRINPMRFQGAVNGQRLDVAVENCTNGIAFTGEVNPVYIGAGTYIESISNIGIDMTAASAHRAVEINGVFFNNVGTAIKGVQMVGGEIGPNNFYTACTKHVDVQDVDSFITVNIPPKPITSSGSLLPTKPSEYDLGTTVRAVYPQVVTSSVDGTAQARCEVLVDHFAPLPWFGRSGRVSGKILWADMALVNTGGSNYNVVITTRIAYEVDVALFFSFTVVDNIGTYKLCGNAAGPTVYASSLAGKTVAIDADGNGYVRFTLSSFSHPSGSISATGAVRMQ